MNIQRHCSASALETQALAAGLGRSLGAGAVVVLDGPLGAGKTCFVQGLAQGLDVPRGVLVNSPSYVLMNVYEGGRLPIYHFDWYRLEQSAALDGLDLPEYFDGAGVTVVEWASKFPEAVPAGATQVSIRIVGEDEREITIETAGD